MYAGFPFTITLTPFREVGIWPWAKDAAVDQKKPPAGVALGTRFVPVIAIYVFWARPVLHAVPKVLITGVCGGPLLTVTVTLTPVTLCSTRAPCDVLIDCAPGKLKAVPLVAARPAERV